MIDAWCEAPIVGSTEGRGAVRALLTTATFTADACGLAAALSEI